MKIKILLCIIILIIIGILLYFIFHKKENPVVILITIDTIRADYVGCYGSKLGTTPYIDAFAKNAVIFANTFTPIPMTLPSHSSILTGLYPMHHGVHDNGLYRLSPRLMTLAKLFKEHGYKTAAVVASYVLNSRYGLSNGFDIYKDQMNVQSDLPYENAQITADEVTKRSIELLKKMKNEKFFMWIHYFDPHALYTPPEKFYKKFSNPYAGEIAFVDSQIKILMDELNNMRLFDKVLFIIVGDHGESFGEHDEMTHGYFLYNTTLKVPFILKLPGSQSEHRTINNEVLTIDIFPTLCDYLHFHCENYGLEGKSLLPLLKHNLLKTFHDSIYAETLLPQIHLGCSPFMALIKDGWKYVQSPKPEMYHYAENGNENENEFEMHKDKAYKYAAQLKDWLEAEKKKEVDASVRLDTESMEKLQALGYIGGNLYQNQNTTNIDIKDIKITIRVLQDANLLFINRHFEEAIAIVENEIKRLNEEKKSVSLLFLYAAQSYAARDEFDKAIVYYKKLITLLPNYADYYVWLAIIYGDEKQDPATAVDYLYASIKLDDKIVESYVLLGDYLLKLQRINEADTIFKKAISYFPENYNLLNSYARLFAVTNRYDEAIAMLNHAVQVAPSLPDAYINSAIVYMDKKDMNTAKRKIEQALRISPSNPLALEVQQKLSSIKK